jgi:hypothetical protein
VAAWLLRPFATSRQLGAGDALWYSHMLADFVTQWRAGIFPVFAGQTEFAFNGAIYPLRAAPLYQHLAGLLDLLTARQLGWFALQHLCVIVMGVAGIFSCYFSLCALAPLLLPFPSPSPSLSPSDPLSPSPSFPAPLSPSLSLSSSPSLSLPAPLSPPRSLPLPLSPSLSLTPSAPLSPSPSPSLPSLPRWFSVGLSILYLSCPGVLGLIYTQDLYMTWMAVPFVPVAFYGVVRAFQRDDVRSQLLLGAALAALWWAHAPVALWATLLCTGIQMVRLLTVHRRAASWKRAAVGILVFGALAHYPFVSVATLHVPGVASAVTSGFAHPEVIVRSIRQAFPGMLLPLSRHAGTLSDLQLGYGLWLILLTSLLALRWVRGWELRLVLASVALLLVLLLPIPGLNPWLWQHVPASIKRITYYWPMQRFYLLLAGLLAIAGQRGLAAWASRAKRTAILAALFLFATCAWSLWEARQFVRAGLERTASKNLTARNQLSENLTLMNHAYGLFSALPPYFSDGVMDAASQTRLLDPASFSPLPNELDPSAKTGRLEGTVDANPGILDLHPTFHLEFGHRYNLNLAFSSRAYDGVLQLEGRTFFREYSLPTSGEPLAFGSGPTNSGDLTLWTSDPAGEEITLRFIPAATGAHPADFTEFANYRWTELEAKKNAVEVISLLPFQAETRSSVETWLETPRMFLPGYRATVDGHAREVRSSPRLLAMIPIEPGPHRVKLVYVGTLVVRASYWLSLAAWITLLASCGITAFYRSSTLSAT